MGYKLEWRPSPNYTPNSQTRAAYGRPRTLDLGAGHWWNTPEAGATHDGVVNMFLSPSRQAAAHAVVSAGRVTEMVRQEDTAWCTGNANPYTYAIECDPRIMWRWQGGVSAAQRELGNAIYNTLCEYIADKGFHNLQWKPHNQFPVPYTQCNPINWGDVMAGAKAWWNQKHNAPPTPQPPANADIQWSQLATPLEMVANKQPTKLWNFNQTSWGGFGNGVKDFNKGERIIIFGKAFNKTLNATYLVTQYSYEKRITNGFNQADLEPYKAPEPPTPEWIRNKKDITPVKLMVLPAQTPIVNLNDLSVIKQLGQGTYVDFVQSTVVSGVEYLISSYSATNGMPNGIRRSDVGLPAEPPVNEKPEWLKNWQDIEDVKMYARADCELVDLIEGKTIKVIERGTEIEIASATLFLDKRYMITKYSTDKQEARGILVDDLDMKPPATEPTPPSPTQPTIDENVNWLVKAIKAILAFFKINV